METFKETEQQMIMRVTSHRENACSCKPCVAMCHKAPCLGTPDDMLKIAKAGFSDRLSRTTWAAATKYGVPEIELIAPKFDQEKKRCTFLTDDDLCMLHDLGLKPTEGRLAKHGLQECTLEEGKLPLTWVVAYTWTFPQNTMKYIELLAGMLGLKKFSNSQ